MHSLHTVIAICIIMYIHACILTQRSQFLLVHSLKEEGERGHEEVEESINLKKAKS